jgi:hypothetical protein
MVTRRTTRRPHASRGAITWVGLVLLAAGAALAYLAFVAVPVYYLNYEVRQVVRDFGNQAVKDPDDAKLVFAMTDRLRKLGDERDPDAEGDGRRPLVVVAPQDVTWERSGSRLHVAFDYLRDIRLPLFDKRIERVFSVDLTLDISRAEWGNAP